jgi:hypothetical protein
LLDLGLVIFSSATIALLCNLATLFSRWKKRKFIFKEKKVHFSPFLMSEINITS